MWPLKKLAKPYISATSAYINQEDLLGTGLRALAVALLTLDVCGEHKWHMSAWGCSRAEALSPSSPPCAGALGQGEGTPCGVCTLGECGCLHIPLAHQGISFWKGSPEGWGCTSVFQGVCEPLCSSISAACVHLLFCEGPMARVGPA